jgi:hypothetical protein
VKRLAIYLLVACVWLLGFLTAKCFASETVIVKSDNTVIRTVHHYGNEQTSVESVELKNPIAEYDCFDRIKLLRNKASRYQAIDKCLQGVPA